MKTRAQAAKRTRGSRRFVIRNRKNWSKEEEREILNLIRPYYPGNIPSDKIQEFAVKFSRTEHAVKSKVQKIKQGHQATLEMELDRLFIKKQGQSDTPKLASRASPTPGKLAGQCGIAEMREYLKSFLSNNAVSGIEQSELRMKVPKYLIDSENLAKLLSELEKEGKISIERHQALELEPPIMQFFDKEAVDQIKKVLKRRYKTNLISGKYPMDILFEDQPALKDQINMTQFMHVRPHNFIFYVD